jgi:hypothetical protein
MRRHTALGPALMGQCTQRRIVSAKRFYEWKSKLNKLFDQRAVPSAASCRSLICKQSE